VWSGPAVGGLDGKGVRKRVEKEGGGVGKGTVGVERRCGRAGALHSHSTNEVRAPMPLLSRSCVLVWGQPRGQRGTRVKRRWKHACAPHPARSTEKRIDSPPAPGHARPRPGKTAHAHRLVETPPPAPGRPQEAPPPPAAPPTRAGAPAAAPGVFAAAAAATPTPPPGGGRLETSPRVARGRSDMAWRVWVRVGVGGCVSRHTRRTRAGENDSGRGRCAHTPFIRLSLHHSIQTHARRHPSPHRPDRPVPRSQHGPRLAGHRPGRPGGPSLHHRPRCLGE
jgi:hypothetical protein